MSLKDYLAKNYGKSSSSHNHKKKKNSSSSLLILEDEDFPEIQKESIMVIQVPQERRERKVQREEEGERGRRKSPSVSPEPNESRRRKSPSMSPTRQESTKDDSSTYKTFSKEEEFDPRMSNGAKAGLQSAESIKRDLETRRQKESLRLSASLHQGKEAATVYRDKSGRKIDVHAERLQLLEKKRKEEEEEEARMEWGKGIKQNKDAQRMAERLKLEQDAPLSVYVDNKERNEELRERDRWGDPMAHLVSKPSVASSSFERKGKSKSKMMYRGPPAPLNRFGILPGYRWDGVVRTNGFESLYFKTKNAAAARTVDAYKWSAADM